MHHCPRCLKLTDGVHTTPDATVLFREVLDEFEVEVLPHNAGGYCIDQSTVSNIKRRRYWSHI